MMQVNLKPLCEKIISSLTEEEVEQLMYAIDSDDEELMDSLQDACMVMYPKLYKRLCEGDDNLPL